MTVQLRHPAPIADSVLVQFWNGTLAPKFLKYRHILVDGLSQHSAAVMPKLPVAPGDTVLDVGCGFGDTSIELASLAQPGQVLGIDCCDAFLDQAWSDAERTWTGNVKFARQDAELGLGERKYDFVFSRFGTMFFANPVRGLTNMGLALKPGGRVAHIVWRDRKDNPWLNEPSRVVRQFLPAPGPEAQTCGPGPFSMANEVVTEMQMSAAGFRNIQFERIDSKVLVGRTIDEAIGFQLALGPAGETFREAGALADERRADIEAALGDLFRKAETNADGIWMDSSSWLITGQVPQG